MIHKPLLCLPFVIDNKYDDQETNRMYNLSRFLEPFFCHPMRQSSSDEDTKQATDLMIMNDNRTRLAVRFLRINGNLTTDNFTRCTIRHEAKVGYTELEKLENNLNPHFLYCSAQASFDERGLIKVHEVVVVDIRNFKDLISPLIRNQTFIRMDDKNRGKNHYSFRWMDIIPERIMFHWAENHVYVNKLNMYSWRNQLAHLLFNRTAYLRYNRQLSDVTMTRWPDDVTQAQWKSLLTPTLSQVPGFKVMPALRPLTKDEYNDLSKSQEIQDLYSQSKESIAAYELMIKKIFNYGDSSGDFRIYTGIC